MAKLCGICNQKAGALSRVKLSDGYMCANCNVKCGTVSNLASRSIQDCKQRIKYMEENKSYFDSFNPTMSVKGYVEIDENRQEFRFKTLDKLRGNFCSEQCFPYSELINFELNEDGETVTKGGMGRAVVGGALFGGTGAIVGGVTGKRKNNTIATSMYIRVSLKNKWLNHHTIQLLNIETKKNGIVYKTAKDNADKIISMLEMITSSQESLVEATPSSVSSPTTAADEILKYKQLLDIGAISQEEYDAKKKELLNI